MARKNNTVKTDSLEQHRQMLKDSDANDYVHMVDGIKGEDDFGLYTSCPVRHSVPYEAVGDGCYRLLPYPRY